MPVHLVVSTPCAGRAAGEAVTDPEAVEHLLAHYPANVLKVAPFPHPDTAADADRTEHKED